MLAWREAKRAEVLAKRAGLTEENLARLVKDLELNPQQSPFSNKTQWTLRKVYEEDHTLLEANFRAYINDDDHVKIFRKECFAFHKVKVVFWQTDEHDQPAIITEPYEKAFTPANLAKEQKFHDSNLTFRVTMKLYAEILATGVFTQKDAAELVGLFATGTDAQVQFLVNALRNRFQEKLTDLEARKAFVYQLARFVKSFHFLTCFFTYGPEIKEFATFAEYVGPQLIKAGSVTDLMKQIRQTEVIKAAVTYQGVESGGGTVKIKSGGGKKGVGPPPKKVSVQDMITEIRSKFDITDEEALYIKQVTEEKGADPSIRSTVAAHREDRIYLDGAYRKQVNGEIQTAYDDHGRYEELSDPKYTDTGAIFDIMAVTVIQHHLVCAA